MFQITVDDLLTLAVLTPFVMALTEGVKRSLEWTDATTKRLGTWLSIAIAELGILGASGWLISQGTPVNIGQSFATGIVSGLVASGLYDAIGEQAGKLVAAVTRGKVNG